MVVELPDHTHLLFKRLINFTIKQTNYIKQHFLQGVMFNMSLVLISILSINDILTKFHSLTKNGVYCFT